MFGGPACPIIQSLQAAAASQDPEDLGDLHHRIVVFGGGGIGAENMFQPDPVVFLGIERVFDQVPFSAGAVDDDGHALRCEVCKVGAIDVEVGGGLVGDFPLQNNIGLVLAQQDVFHPAEILLPLLAPWPEQNPQPVGPMEGQQSEGFVPRGGLASFLEGQDVFPIELFAGGHDGLAAVERVSQPGGPGIGRPDPRAHVPGAAGAAHV